MLTGNDAGKKFIGVIEVMDDMMPQIDMLGQDPRGRVVVHFTTAPDISSQALLQTSNGKKWVAVKRSFSSFLTTDFDLREVSSEKDF